MLVAWSPIGFLLGQTVLRSYADDGTFVDLDSVQPFPLVANRVPVGTLSLPTPHESGWMEVVLVPGAKEAVVATAGPFPVPAYVAVLQSGDDRATLRRAINFASSGGE